MEEIKDCPFCGAEADVQNQFNQEFWVQCIDLSCGSVDGTVHVNPIEAITNWNRRAVPQANAEQDARRVETLYAAIQKAAGKLPEGYTIKIEVERDAGWVEWAGPDCEWKLSDGNDGYMCQAVEEAIDAAIRAASKTTPASGEGE